MPLIPGGGRKKRRPPVPPSGERTVLTQSDFTFLGTYVFPDITDGVYGRAVTHRYTSGNLQIISTQLQGIGSPNRFEPVLWSLPAGYLQNMVQGSGVSNFWNSGFGLADAHMSLWYDEVNQSCWAAASMDYPWDAPSLLNTAVLTKRTIPTAGACSDFIGWQGFEGIGSRAAFGKPQRVPAWFRTQYSLPEYVSLSGGYTSLAAQGLGSSFGPMFFFFNDPWGYTPIAFGGTSFSVPAASVTIKADFRSGSTAYDWYSGNPNLTTFANRSTDRAARVTAVDSYTDFGSDYRGENPNYPPVLPPNANGNWLSPCTLDPQGYGRWTWIDSFFGSGNWIDSVSKHGIVMIATVQTGRSYYMSSSLHNDGRAAELHIYDPVEVATTTVPYHLRPSSLFVLSDVQQYCNNGSRFDATYDSVTGRLYVMHYWATYQAALKNLLHVYQVST